MCETRRVVFIGGGYSARAFARLFRKDRDLVGTTRNPIRCEKLERVGLRPMIFDGTLLADDLRAALDEATDIVISASPLEGCDPVLAALKHHDLSLPKLKWLAYLSTVGVYGEHHGNWVNEQSETRSALPRAQSRVTAEDAWQRFANDRRVECAVLRLGGIYGPGRNPFLKLREGTARRIVKPGQVANWVHAHDIAGALDFLMERRGAGIFNVVDDEPAPSRDKIAFAALLMGVTPPEEVPYDSAAISPYTRSFFSENRRVSNAKLRDLGYEFRYPNFQMALSHLWESGEWSADW